MEVTLTTWVIALLGLLIMGLLMTLQIIAVIKPKSSWTIKNIYGGKPANTDPKAYFAFNQGFAFADVFFWGPLQLAASVGMIYGARWGFLLGLVGSVPFIYTAIQIYIWDRDMGYRENTFTYWVFIWGMFPVFGIFQLIYCFVRIY